ncbi:MAG: crossover junction endodeoxyribonuclease RuvC [Pseudoclavibacter sp.]|nr:crossover junction endodeoxyribonuclease RuvC [Pseudoclavibacter sp.]
MAGRVLGVDPGLTRCGIGVVEMDERRRTSLVHVEVLRSGPELELAERLRVVGAGVERALDEHAPDRVALERVFAQHNLRTVMGTAQISGVVLYAAAQRGLSVELHTPSEVKAAITGYGDAGKRQVGVMVQRLLGLSEAPRPADAADALALAICSVWKTPLHAARTRPSAPAPGGRTRAQEAWLAAERAAARGRQRLG